MKLYIDQESSVPIYVQIEDSIHSLIAAGQIQPGEQLPTIRELAAQIRVNLNTVARAYLELDREGVISTQRGKGTFVTGVPDKEQIERKRQKLLHSIINSALEEAQNLGYSPSEIKKTFQEEMKEWLNGSVDEILSKSPNRILEIGCGTGMILFQIAPYSNHYTGTDISSVALHYIEQQKKTWEFGSKVTLFQSALSLL